MTEPDEASYTEVSSVDQEAADILREEKNRQKNTLMMIASENHASEAVLDAQGSVFTNKYAEGYPGKRYYAGCGPSDKIEELAQSRAKELWGADYVNVQPHSGSQANMAVYAGLLELGDKILALNLNGGGHLSHGAKVSLTGKNYNIDRYTVDPDTGRLDYEAVKEQAKEFGPDLIVSGYSAYPRTVDWEAMQDIADEVDAIHMADIAHITGLVAAGEHPSPVGIADVVTGSTHKTIRSGRGGMVMTNNEEYASAIDSALFPGIQGGPLMHNIAGKAVGFKQALNPEFKDYAKSIVDSAKAMAEQFKENGFSPVSDGTDVHLVLLDLRESHPDITGLEAHKEIGRAHV